MKGLLTTIALLLLATTALAQDPAPATGPHIKGNVFGGGRMANVGKTEATAPTTATIDIYASTIEGGVFGGNDITGAVAQAAGDGKASAKITVHDACDGTCSVKEVYGGGNGYYKYKIGDTTIDIGTITDDNKGTAVDANTLVEVLDASGTKVAEFTTTAATTYGGLLPTLGNTSVIVGEATNAKDKVALAEVYGGAKNAYVIGASNVTVQNCTIGTVYGGNNYGGNIESTNVYIKGEAKIGTAETPGAVYGGGRSADVTHATNVTMLGDGTNTPTVYGNVFGGCDVSGNVGTTHTGRLDISNVDANIGYAKVQVQGGTVTGRVFGGGNGLESADGTVKYQTSTLPTIMAETSAPNETYVYADGNYQGKTLPQVENSWVTLKGCTIGTTTGSETHTLFGGGQGAGTRVIHNVDLEVGDDNESVETIVKGISYGGSYAGFVNTDCSDHTRTLLQGYGSNTQVQGDIYGGSYGNYVRGEISLNINNISVGVDENAAGIYAGNNSAGQPECQACINYVSNDCNVTLYGGGNMAPFYGTTRITFTKGTVGYIYGGGNNADVYGNTIVEVLGGHVCHDVFGGGNNGTVKVNKATDTEHNKFGQDYGGNTLVIVRDDCLQTDASGNLVEDAITGNYAANRGTTSYFNVYNADGTIAQTVDPYTADKQIYVLKPNDSGTKSTIQIDGNVFGGGNAADVEGKATILIGNK